MSEERRIDLCKEVEALEVDTKELQDIVMSLDRRVREATIWKWLTAGLTAACTGLLGVVFSGMLAGTGAFGVVTHSDLVTHTNDAFHPVGAVQYANQQQQIARLTKLAELNAEVLIQVSKDMGELKWTINDAFPESATRSGGGDGP